MDESETNTREINPVEKILNVMYKITLYSSTNHDDFRQKEEERETYFNYYHLIIIISVKSINS